MFAFCCDVFSFIIDAAENETGSDFDLDVFRDGDIDTAKCAESFDDGVFFEFGVYEIQVDSAKDSDDVGTLEGFFIIGALIAGEDGGLGIHDFAVFEVLDFFTDFFIAVGVEDAAEDEAETDGNQNDGEDNLPGDVVREDILSCEKKNDANADYDEAGELLFVGEEADDAGDDDE